MCRRASVAEQFSEPINLGPTVNSSDRERGAAICSDGRVLYFYSDRPGGQGDYDLWMCTAKPRRP